MERGGSTAAIACAGGDSPSKIAWIALWSTMYSVPATCTFYALAQTTTKQAFVHATAYMYACMHVYLRVTTCEGVYTHTHTHTLACQTSGRYLS
jgi:hypothetical protein